MNRWIWGEYRDWGVLEGHPDPRDPLITSQCVAYDIYWTALTEGYGQTDRGRSEGVDPRSKGVIWGSKRGHLRVSGGSRPDDEFSLFTNRPVGMGWSPSHVWRSSVCLPRVPTGHEMR